ncbi:MAG: hypothetical protein ABW148_00435 [Sedimenticola sp.]
MSAASAAPSLVRGSKSSTGAFETDIDELNDVLSASAEFDREEGQDADYYPHEWQQQDFPEAPGRMFCEYERDEIQSGKYISIECEQWRGIERTTEGLHFTPLNPELAVWKAAVVVEGRAGKAPPPQVGDRWTKRLSDRGKKQIEHSALYLHKTGQGYRTFLTLTMRPEWRAQVEKWDQMERGEEGRSTIGRLATEFTNTLQQRYRNGKTFDGHYRRHGKQKTGGGYSSKNGWVAAWNKSAKWTPIIWREGFKIPAQRQPFKFVWVIENPENESGERNPHIHLLMNWHVKLDQFHAWAGWIERTWGKGWAKLERIKKPAAAAHYMAKAANYLTKGSEGKQGPVRGNRYSVARDARAPKARFIGHYWTERIWEVLQAGREMTSEKRNKKIWFHKYGMGANCRKMWGSFWQALKKDGVKLGPPLPGLHAVRFCNAGAALLRKKFDWKSHYINTFFEDAESMLEGSSNWEPVTAYG